METQYVSPASKEMNPNDGSVTIMTDRTKRTGIKGNKKRLKGMDQRLRESKVNKVITDKHTCR